MDNKYQEIYQRSIKKPEEFWSEIANNIFWYKKPSKILNSDNPPFYKWFQDGVTNTCYNAVDLHVKNGNGKKIAIIYDSPITNSQKKSHYRTATLNNILKTRRRMKEKARDDGLKIREMLFLGDLNMRLSKSERRKLEYQDEEASDSDDEADDNISWNDHTEKGTYSKNEMRIVYHSKH